MNEKLIEKLEDSINYSGDDMDYVSWGIQEGVLISGNEAKLFIELLKKTDTDGDE